eukprot:362040-Chlamydomonas_euryale.AAC.1
MDRPDDGEVDGPDDGEVDGPDDGEMDRWLAPQEAKCWMRLLPSTPSKWDLSRRPPSPLPPHTSVPESLLQDAPAAVHVALHFPLVLGAH